MEAGQIKMDALRLRMEPRGVHMEALRVPMAGQRVLAAFPPCDRNIKPISYRLRDLKTQKEQLSKTNAWIRSLWRMFLKMSTFGPNVYQKARAMECTIQT